MRSYIDYLIALTVLTDKKWSDLEFQRTKFKKSAFLNLRSRALFIVMMSILHKSFQMQWSRFRAPRWWLHTSWATLFHLKPLPTFPTAHLSLHLTTLRVDAIFLGPICRLCGAIAADFKKTALPPFPVLPCVSWRTTSKQRLHRQKPATQRSATQQSQSSTYYSSLHTKAVSLRETRQSTNPE